MRVFPKLIIGCLAGIAAFAQGPGKGSGGNGGSGGGGSPNTIPTIALKIPNETVPPGGVAQMKFLNTEPTPISSGRPHTFYDPSMFDDVWGIELFNPTGDLNGIAQVSGSAISIAFESTGAVQGTDYPVMTIALHVRPDAPVGSQTQFDADASTTFTVGSVPAIVKPIAPATVAVGGSISITNVVPGGGLQPAGSTIKILGIGFQPRTQIQLTDFQAQSIQVISATEIDIVLAQATNMTGKKVQVVNPDRSQDTYFSYLRGINLKSSNRPLLANAVPIFSSVQHTQATFAPLALPVKSQFNGLAMQNSGAVDANVTVSLYSLFGGVLETSTITIPSGYRLVREVSELTGGSSTLPLASLVVVSSDSPIQVFGLLADTVAQTLTPFPAIFAQP